jgi:hypothetical protein
VEWALHPFTKRKDKLRTFVAAGEPIATAFDLDASDILNRFTECRFIQKRFIPL